MWYIIGIPLCIMIMLAWYGISTMDKDLEGYYG